MYFSLSRVGCYIPMAPVVRDGIFAISAPMGLVGLPMCGVLGAWLAPSWAGQPMLLWLSYQLLALTKTVKAPPEGLARLTYSESVTVSVI